MALPILMGAMAIGQLVQTGIGLYQQHKMQEQNKEALKMMMAQQQQQNQSLQAFMGGGVPGAGGFPQQQFG